jgi:hypothetical protein
VLGEPSGRHNTRSDRRCLAAFNAAVNRCVNGSCRDLPHGTKGGGRMGSRRDSPWAHDRDANVA